MWITVSEAARILKTDRLSVHQMIKTGRLVYKGFGIGLRIDRKDAQRRSRLIIEATNACYQQLIHPIPH
jgi:excisionase family DNA binding protein